MPRQERFKTKYPGVYFIEADGARGKERIFYIYYRRNGKQIEEKAGCQYADDMTEAKASGIRADRMRGKELPNTEKREAAKAAKMEEAGKWTLSRLWDEYEKIAQALLEKEQIFKSDMEEIIGKRPFKEHESLVEDKVEDKEVNIELEIAELPAEEIVVIPAEKSDDTPSEEKF